MNNNPQTAVCFWHLKLAWFCICFRTDYLRLNSHELPSSASDGQTISESQRLCQSNELLCVNQQLSCDWCHPKSQVIHKVFHLFTAWTFWCFTVTNMMPQWHFNSTASTTVEVQRSCVVYSPCVLICAVFHPEVFEGSAPGKIWRPSDLLDDQESISTYSN